MNRIGDWETKWLAESLSKVPGDRPIYIAGLARSGSTILLECLAAHPDVVSHQYRDFPFVQIPYWWNWFVERASPSDQALVERSHGDRIQVSPRSPEAMEEILWMSFFPDTHDPTRSQVLGAADRHPEFETFYRNHIRKVLVAREGRRYLAKGNYNLSRLEYLLTVFPSARFIVPVRDPVAHIASLMKQHRLFCATESREPRVLAYMQRAGHFEFGLDRRPINVGTADTVRRVEDLWREGREAEGWALYWSSLYGFVAEQLSQNESLAAATQIVDYEDFCSQPEPVLTSVLDHCGLALDRELVREQAARISEPSYYEPEFSPQEIDLIRDLTAETVEQLRNCTAVQTPA